MAADITRSVGDCLPTDSETAVLDGPLSNLRHVQPTAGTSAIVLQTATDMTTPDTTDPVVQKTKDLDGPCSSIFDFDCSIDGLVTDAFLPTPFDLYCRDLLKALETFSTGLNNTPIRSSEQNRKCVVEEQIRLTKEIVSLGGARLDVSKVTVTLQGPLHRDAVSTTGLAGYCVKKSSTDRISLTFVLECVLNPSNAHVPLHVNTNIFVSDGHDKVFEMYVKSTRFGRASDDGRYCKYESDHPVDLTFVQSCLAKKPKKQRSPQLSAIHLGFEYCGENLFQVPMWTVSDGKFYKNKEKVSQKEYEWTP